MRSFRPTVGYSDVMATIAVFMALGGGAYAVTSSPGGGVVTACAKKKAGALRVIKQGKRCKRGERKLVWNVQGLAGNPGGAGLQGPKGDAGQQGAKGDPGSTGATGSAGATPANITMLSENWGGFGWPVWTNQPAALTELFGTTTGRTRADLTASSQVRIEVNVAQAGAATAAIRAQYSTDQTSWNYLDGGTGPSVNINATGLKVSSWVNLASGAKGDVFLRAVGLNGDATADPGFSNIILQVK